MKYFVKRDLDGFFGLFVDNLVQLLIIISFCTALCGMTGEKSALLYQYILPGAAVSILLGNVFYAWQAHRLAMKTGRDDVTALPYGINTPSLIVFVFFVIKPVYDETGDATLAWKMGLIACLGSGVIELLGAFVAGTLRKCTPRAALLSTLAGIAIGFISMTFALQIFNKPFVAMLPLAIVLIGLFSQIRLPLGLPSGFLAVLIGTASAWLLTVVKGSVNGLPEWVTYGAGNLELARSAYQQVGWVVPVWGWEQIRPILMDYSQWLPFLSVIVPMGLFNVIGSLQNIESAEAAGDSYPTAPSMVANGVGTIIAALFGSCFPTTIYIGHPGWKELGARAGYSTLNGVVIVAFCLSGLVGLCAAIVPLEAGAAIVLWIGIIITAQAFRAVPENHAPAVAVGLFPAIAAWGATVMLGTVLVSNGRSLAEIINPPVPSIVEEEAVTESPETPEESLETDLASAGGTIEEVDQLVDEVTVDVPVKTVIDVGHPSAEVNGFLVHGLLLMERGYIFTCMILSATCACLIDRKFVAAGMWMLAASVLTWLGAMHAYQVHHGMAFDFLFRFVAPIDGASIYRANDIAIGYLACGILFLALSSWLKRQPTQSH
ncbi:NCS2 family permease [Thalassoglobus sp. JC818]|uniref:NCS2 family permease n=1 Tax=Thalassoglobus sp. JC818 TaxID=3232136 RepID=UPI0034580FDD